MTRCVLALVGFLLLTAAAQADIVRLDLRLPIAGTDHGLETLLVKPNATGRYPLVLMSHGSPRDANRRREMSAYQYFSQAMEFARRGWAVAVAMRRGFGESAGPFLEGYGTCDDPDYGRASTVAAGDLRAAITELAKRPDIDASRILAVGISVGGLATIALSLSPVPGLVAAINFAGGSGSSRPDFVCREERLVETFRAYGRASRTPMLWVYAKNDRYFGPALAEKFHGAFAAGGNTPELVITAPFRDDGHELFTVYGTALWTPLVDAFLKRQGLMLRSNLLALPPSRLVAPRSLSESGQRSFRDYMASGPHKAFAISNGNNYGWRAARRTVEDAKREALANCRKSVAAECRIVAVDDEAVR
jgi:dienelactone hydrolase